MKNLLCLFILVSLCSCVADTDKELQIYEVLCDEGAVQYVSVERWNLEKEIDLCE